MKKATRPWIRKAEEDFLAAGKLVLEKEPLHDVVCFHCQQCAEKYLKALLEEQGLQVPRTHNLDDLYHPAAPHYPTLTPLRRGLIYLSDFAVTTRYPGDNATKRQAATAMRRMTRVRTDCRSLLGIRTRRKRTK